MLVGVRYELRRSGALDWDRAEDVGGLLFPLVLLGWLVSWPVHWLVFRGGWTVRTVRESDGTVVRAERYPSREAATRAVELLRAAPPEG